MPPKASKAASKAEEEKKRKAEEAEKAKAEEPAAKAAKVEKAKEAEEEPEVEDEDAEHEKDDKADKRPQITAPVGFNMDDTTLNVLKALDGKVLMTLTDGGMQYLVAGARANVGVKAGRYFYEVRIVELLNPSEGGQARSRAGQPRQLVRIGFSLGNASLVLDNSTEDHFYFDNEGFFSADKKKLSLGARFTRDQVVGVLLNLDPKSKNANTVSLFKDGERVSKPQPIPEALKGKTLFPAISYRNVSVQVNFGAHPMAGLPFSCRMLQAAAKDDAVPVAVPKKGQCEVVFPVGVPDEGTFDWLDGFLEKNPGYTELSDRKILDWAQKSGLARPPQQAKGSWKNSMDKPDVAFGVPLMDDLSARKVIHAIAPAQQRNYVVMEVKSNLVAEERKAMLRKFSSSSFKRVAHVVMGEPAQDHVKLVHERMLKDKQDAENTAFKVRKLERERQRIMKEKAKAAVAARKAAEERKKKLLEDAKKRALESKAKADAEKKAKEDEEKKAKDGEGEGEEEKKDEEKKDEEMKDAEEEMKKRKKDEEKKDEEQEKEEEEEEEEGEEETEPKKAELTEEDKALKFRKRDVPDVSSFVMNSAFADFSVPTKAEGFDEVIFAWEKKTGSTDYLKNWVLERKITSRMESLQPSDWFKEKYAAWQKVLGEWKVKQTEWEKKAGKPTPPDPKEADKKDGEGEKEADDADKKDDDKMEAEDLDIFSVENVCDVGTGEPLFGKFSWEDWALITLRFELHMLIQGFQHDANDPERKGIHESNVAFYFNKYYKKPLNLQMYGCETNADICELISDTIQIGKDRVLEGQLEANMENYDIFVKLTEEGRRKRQRRIDAGDESGKLKFVKPTEQKAWAGAGWQPGAGGAANAVRPGWRPAWQQPGAIRPAQYAIKRPYGKTW